jgi:hypothetical protein
MGLSINFLIFGSFCSFESRICSPIAAGVAGNSWNQLLNCNPCAIHPFYLYGDLDVNRVQRTVLSPSFFRGCGKWLEFVSGVSICRKHISTRFGPKESDDSGETSQTPETPPSLSLMKIRYWAQFLCRNSRAILHVFSVRMTCRSSTDNLSERGVSSPKLFRDELEKSETPFRGVSG